MTLNTHCYTTTGGVDISRSVHEIFMETAIEEILLGITVVG
jgi:hypothetical protein